MTVTIPLEPGGAVRAGHRLSQVLKALRRLRGKRPAEVACAMGMPLRSYEHFEAGRGRLNLARLQAFAEATDTDGMAILASLILDSPDFAVRCADNKLMTVLMMTLGDFDARVGNGLSRLPPRAAIVAFERAFAALGDEAAAGDTVLDVLLGRRPPLDAGSSPEPPPDEQA